MKGKRKSIRRSVSPEEFFKLVALNSGASDLKNVKDIFYGMIRTISRELRNKGIVDLPDWGRFEVKIYKERRILDVNLKELLVVPETPMVKFYPCKAVKKYFYSLGGERKIGL